jgi:hypothetical protein
VRWCVEDVFLINLKAISRRAKIRSIINFALLSVGCLFAMAERD